MANKGIRASVKRELERAQGNLDWVTQHLAIAGKPFLDECEISKNEFKAMYGYTDEQLNEDEVIHAALMAHLNQEYVTIYSAIDELITIAGELKTAIDFLDSKI